MPTIHIRATRAEVRQILGTIPAILAGQTSDPSGVAKALQLRMGNALLSTIQQQFMVKSRGGTDSAGIKWAPLSPYTIANRRTTPGELKSLGVKQGKRGFLTPGENAKWERIFAKRLRILEAKGFPAVEAKKQAARVAWAELKQQGAKTKLAVLGSRTVDIGRDTSRMFHSLAAGYDDAPPGSADTTLRFVPGSLIVGTNVPYFKYFNYGTANQPARPIAPLDGSIPDAWWPPVLDAGVRGIAVVVEELLRRG